MTVLLEHANVTVADPDETARWMCDIFDWHIRWQGPSAMGGKSVHVGTKGQYLALYTPGEPRSSREPSHGTVGGLNHIGVVVDDLDKTEDAVKKHGFTPGSHGDYEPGRRFYFADRDGIEYEVVSYS